MDGDDRETGNTTPGGSKTVDHGACRAKPNNTAPRGLPTPETAPGGKNNPVPSLSREKGDQANQPPKPKNTMCLEQTTKYWT